MSDEFANTLAWLAVLLLAPGVLIMSPTGRFFCLVLAAIIALVPLIFGSMKRRVFAGVVLGISLLVGAATYSDFRKDYELYLERAQQKGEAPSEQAAPSSTPTQQDE